MPTETEYRIYIDDVNSVRIGSYISANWSIKAIGFDNEDPVYREIESTYIQELPDPRRIRDALKVYRLSTRKKIEEDIFHLQTLLESLDKEPVFESQINPPENNSIPVHLQAELQKEYFEVNEFAPPNWNETDQRIQDWINTPSKERTAKDRKDLVFTESNINLEAR